MGHKLPNQQNHTQTKLHRVCTTNVTQKLSAKIFGFEVPMGPFDLFLKTVLDRHEILVVKNRTLFWCPEFQGGWFEISPGKNKLKIDIFKKQIIIWK